MAKPNHTRITSGAQRLCSVEECGRKLLARGLCRRHYKRNQRYGDPLGGRSYENDRGAARQFLLNTVLRYAGDDCLIWPFLRDKNGYGYLYYSKAIKFTHRVVCEEVNGPPPSPTHMAAHGCGKGSSGCCTPKHLRWASREENMTDAVAHGSMVRGVRHHNAKLTEADVKEIRRLSLSHSQNAIAKQFGVSRENIRAIQKGDNWGWLK